MFVRRSSGSAVGGGDGSAAGERWSGASLDARPASAERDGGACARRAPHSEPLRLPLVRRRNRDYRVEHSIELMKRIILSVVVLFFALAVRAEDAKVSQGAKDKDMPSCRDLLLRANGSKGPSADTARSNRVTAGPAAVRAGRSAPWAGGHGAS